MLSLGPGPSRLSAVAHVGSWGCGFHVCWVRVWRLWVGLCGAGCSALLPEFQGMLKDVSEGKAPEPPAVLPAAGSQVRAGAQVRTALGAQWLWGLACPGGSPLDELWRRLQNCAWGTNTHLCFRLRHRAPSTPREAAAVMLGMQGSSMWLPGVVRMHRSRGSSGLQPQGPVARGRELSHSRGWWTGRGRSLRASASKTSCPQPGRPSRLHTLA